jgi:hypothetical protein
MRTVFSFKCDRYDEFVVELLPLLSARVDNAKCTLVELIRCKVPQHSLVERMFWTKREGVDTKRGVTKNIAT